MYNAHKGKTMVKYTWAIWKNCRIVEYIESYSERDALKIAKLRHGDNIFIERCDAFSHS